MSRRSCFALASLTLALTACGIAPHRSDGPVAASAPSATVAAVRPAQPARADEARPTHTQRGKVSWYGRKWEGRTTASGETYDADALTMAHRTLPFGTRVRVVAPETNRSVVVRVNDRGPYVDGRVADLSLAAASQLGIVGDGVVDAELQILGAPEVAVSE